MKVKQLTGKRIVTVAVILAVSVLAVLAVYSLEMSESWDGFKLKKLANDTPREIELLPSSGDKTVGVSMQGTSAMAIEKGKYLGYSGIDLTGMRSVRLDAEVKMHGSCNGDTIRVMIDNPISGAQIGSIVIDKEGTTFEAPLTATEGVHDLYFVGGYWNGVPDNFITHKITLSEKAYDDSFRSADQVPDSAIRDMGFQNWVSVDEMGRAVATYGETGGVKAGERIVGTLFWNWHNGGGKNARIISEILAEYPNALEDPNSPGWADGAITYWDESVFGYYASNDYWVCRQQMDLLAAADVDVIILDCSNGGWLFLKSLGVLAQAMRDAKAAGVDIPRLSVSLGDSGFYEADNCLVGAIYNVAFVKNDWSDIWFYWPDANGVEKPLLVAWANADSLYKAYETNDTSGREMVDTINEFFTWEANRGGATSGWDWLEAFPQKNRVDDKMADGRNEFITLGMALNASYVDTNRSSAFSAPYAMGKSYSAAFGEDYSADGSKKAWMFRDQSRQALEVDPHFVFVCGWNEFTAIRQATFWGLENVFVDTFDSDNSRDFEPVKGELKDTFYNLLVDFVRKYKGTKPADVAGPEVTISMEGDASQWDAVTPAYHNYEGVDRDSYSGYTNPATGELWHYTTSSANRVTYAKVARDADSFYFLAETVEGETLNDAAVYINIDRNYATGYEGYDLVIGRNGGNAVESMAADGSYTALGTAELVRSNNRIQIKVSRTMLGETGVADFEFKWVTGTFTDIISLYEYANAAPIGRFNYLYTELATEGLTDSEREPLESTNTTVLKADSQHMIVAGGIQTVCEGDVVKVAVERNGTLYIPAEAIEEIIGYGRSQIEFNEKRNLFYIYDYTMNEDLTAIAERNWYYAELGKTEGRANGRLRALTAPIEMIDGDIYVPITVFSELMGKTVREVADGVYAIGDATEAQITAAASYLD